MFVLRAVCEGDGWVGGVSIVCACIAARLPTPEPREEIARNQRRETRCPAEYCAALRWRSRSLASRAMERGSALDVLSPSFDSELALASPALSEQLCALFPQARPLNNINELRRLLPATAADAVATDHHRRAGSSHALAPKVAAPEARPGVDTRTADATKANASAAGSGRQKLTAQWREQFAEGPIGALGKLVKRRVRVVTRHESGLRGWCEGQLLLCDRRFDLLLADAVEHFVTESPADRGRQWQERRSPQLLLRGDGIISVCELTEAYSSARTDRAAFGKLLLAGTRDG